MKKYRDVTEADIGKQCEFWDNDSKGKWLSELTKLTLAYAHDENGLFWSNCRIEVEEETTEQLKSTPNQYVEVPENLTESEALEALKKASDEKLTEGWYLVEHVTSKSISVRYLNIQKRWESSIGGHWSEFYKHKVISRMEEVK